MKQGGQHTEVDSFVALWKRCLRKGKINNSGADIHRRLLLAYAEPQRVYHTLEHIEACLTLFDDVKHLLDEPDALALAIWFHDAIYELGADDNEQRSADWFTAETDGLFEDDLRELVYSHIIATLHCGREIENHDSQFMVDIDLSSFGKPWSEFLLDSEKVRNERADITDDEFYPKQCDFQKALLERPRFFQSDYFFDNYEKQARQNLIDFFALIEKKQPCR